MKFLTLILCFLMVLPPSLAQTIINTDSVSIGKKGSSANSSIKLKKAGGTTDITVDNPTGDLRLGASQVKIGSSANAIRVNGGNLEFTNDGTIYKKVGSGSGGSGGINLIENASFEDGTVGWTNSGGTFTVLDYNNPAPDNLKYARFVASGSGQYLEYSAVVPDNLGAGCQTQFDKYATATNSAWKIVALDVSNNVLATQNFNSSGGSTTFINTPRITFPCPSTGATVKFRIESLAAATIDLDLAYGGGNRNVFDIAQARLAGKSFFPGTAACTPSRTNTAIGPFGADTDCVGPTIEYSSLGSWQTTDSDLIRQTINNLPAGTYEATFLATVSSSGADWFGLAINDGTTTCEPVEAGNNNVNTNATNRLAAVSCVFTYSSAGNRTFELYGSSASGAVTVTNARTSPRASTKFILKYFPNDSQTAVTEEQGSWFIDANIGGDSPSLGTAGVSTYTGITAANLDMVLRTGSATAQIGCAGTTAATGLTCTAANESVSVAFTPPSAGYYEVCVAASWIAVNGVGGQLSATYQLVETADGSQTIIQEGGERIYMNYNVASSNIAHPVNVCGTFLFSAATKRVVRLMYEQTVSGTVSSSLILADRDGTAGQRDIKFNVRPLLSANNRVYLTGDQVRAPGVTNPKTCYYAFGGASATLASPTECTTGTCTEVVDTCGTGSPPTWASVSVYNPITFGSGTWASNSFVHCDCLAFDTTNSVARKCETYFVSGQNTWSSNSSGGFSVAALTSDQTGSLQTAYVSLKCEGQAP